MTTPAGPLAVSVGSLSFRNPVVLAAGTAGYGRELEEVIDLDRIGGFVTKAVSVQPRHGAPAPRVAEIDGGMINAVGLANPGLAAVRDEHLPWLAAHHSGTRRLANIVGFTVDEFAMVVGGLDEALAKDGRALDGYELNVSCPNTKAGGIEFGADPESLRTVVKSSRAATQRPLFVKLSPTLPDIGVAARIAADAGADGITVVNTIPGLVIDLEQRRPMLGFGTGGVSGPAILPVGVLATWKVRNAVSLPIIGVGGVSRGDDALQYIIAGASLVGVGTAAMRDPRQPERIVAQLDAWCKEHGVRSLDDLRGTLQWPA
jgi:dihydroorotate dehydrogenase (NAD+) catalytic subunit